MRQILTSIVDPRTERVDFIANKYLHRSNICFNVFAAALSDLLLFQTIILAYIMFTHDQLKYYQICLTLHL